MVAVAGLVTVLTAQYVGLGIGQSSSPAASGPGPKTSGGALLESNRVSAGGSYQTKVDVAVPEGPMAPSVSLVYDSGSSSALAGVGWDLSVGYPITITRDTRFGTPEWKRDSAWLWGSSPLVSTNQSQCTQSGICRYRLAPDSLTTVELDFSKNQPTAEVSLPSGIILKYKPVIYDGQSYPNAPPVTGGTNVMGFLLQSATDANGYQACYFQKHSGDKERGSIAVLQEITYGFNINQIIDPNDPNKRYSCSSLPSAGSRHSVTFQYSDLGMKGYAVPWTMRFGAPVSFPSLLESITVRALGNEQREITLAYEPP